MDTPMNTSSRITAGLPPMSDETRGHGIKRRREALGIFTQREFERATERVKVKVPRASIANAEAGEATEQIYTRLETALERLEEETGQNDPESVPAGQVRFTLHDVYGIGEVIAEGPPGTEDEIAESLSKLIRQIRAEKG